MYTCKIPNNFQCLDKTNGKQEKELDSMTAMLAAQLLQQLSLWINKLVNRQEINRQLFQCCIDYWRTFVSKNAPKCGCRMNSLGLSSLVRFKTDFWTKQDIWYHHREFSETFYDGLTFFTPNNKSTKKINYRLIFIENNHYLQP